MIFPYMTEDRIWPPASSVDKGQWNCQGIFIIKKSKSLLFVQRAGMGLQEVNSAKKLSVILC